MERCKRRRQKGQTVRRKQVFQIVALILPDKKNTELSNTITNNSKSTGSLYPLEFPIRPYTFFFSF